MGESKIMKNLFKVLLVLGVPGVGKLLLLVSLASVDEEKASFAYLFIIEAFALLVFSLSFASLDTFVTRHWNSVRNTWVQICLANLKQNAKVGICVLSLSLPLSMFEFSIITIGAAIISQFFANLGRTVFAALRLEKKFYTLGAILVLSNVVTNVAFFMFTIFLSLVPLQSYFLGMMVGNCVYLLYFGFRVYSGKKYQEIPNAYKIDLTNFMKKNKFLETGSIVVQNFERFLLYSLLPLEALNLVAQMYKFTTVLDIYSRAFKLISLEKILLFVDFGPSHGANFLTSRVIFYLIGFPLAMINGVFLFIFLGVEGSVLLSFIAFSLCYFAFNTAFFYTTALFRENVMVYNVIADFFAIIVVLPILIFMDMEEAGILVTISSKFILSIMFRIMAASYVKPKTDA